MSSILSLINLDNKVRIHGISNFINEQSINKEQKGLISTPANKRYFSTQW